MHPGAPSSRPFITVTVAFAIIQFVCWHIFSMPLDLLDGAVSDAGSMATAAVEGNSTRAAMIALGGILGAALIWHSGRGAIKTQNALSWIILGYIAWATLSYLWSDNPEITMRRLGAFLFVSIAACGLATFGIERIRTFFLLASLAVLAVGLANELYLGTFVPSSADYRFAGTLHPNAQGANDAIIILLSLTYAMEGKRHRIFWLLLAGLAFGFLYLTGSRTALICLLVSAVALLAVRVFRTTPRHLCVAGLAVLLVVGSGIFLQATLTTPPTAWMEESIQARRDRGDVESFTGRASVWQTCLDYASDRPLLGFGYNSFWTGDRIREISSAEQWGVNQAHSAYLDILLALGVPGLTLFVAALFGGIALSASRYVQTGAGAFLAFFSLFIFVVLNSITESIALQPVSIGFAMIVALGYLGFRPRAEEPESRVTKLQIPLGYRP